MGALSSEHSGSRNKDATASSRRPSGPFSDILDKSPKSSKKSVKTTPANKEYRMLDVVATQQVLAVSDRLWTEGTGSRTPVGGLGTFWDDKSPAEEALDIDDLLGD